MAIQDLNENSTQKVAGGANPDVKKKWHFRCTICGNEWDKEIVGSPKRVHGCPFCGWWFESLKDNGNWEKECVKYSDPDL